jgi:aryl carrier-like protein
MISEEVAYIAPRTENEQRLALLWQETLHLERISIYDNFFRLGGDSILSAQIAARANREGLRITPRQMFQYQTIAELAEIATLKHLTATTETRLSSPTLRPFSKQTQQKISALLEKGRESQ